jgi:hypothetical protein
MLNVGASSMFRMQKCGTLYNKFILINNAGSLGRLEYIGSAPTCDISTSVGEISETVNLNVTAGCVLTEEVTIS